MTNFELFGMTPNSKLVWAIETVSETIEEADSDDVQDAWELVKERLKQAHLDVDFYKRHYEGELPLDECYCDDCMELRSLEKRREMIEQLGED